MTVKFINYIKFENNKTFLATNIKKFKLFGVHILINNHMTFLFYFKKLLILLIFVNCTF